MRRSGAPSQLGNAVKKPRFMPPGASASLTAAGSKPAGLNALHKVYFSEYFICIALYTQKVTKVLYFLLIKAIKS
uniref:Uncharacterized protein n=1 Tax=Salarias fasciatus TaxID=181472 RepID=A0A672G4P6_SALFA